MSLTVGGTTTVLVALARHERLLASDPVAPAQLAAAHQFLNRLYWHAGDVEPVAEAVRRVEREIRRLAERSAALPPRGAP